MHFTPTNSQTFVQRPGNMIYVINFFIQHNLETNKSNKKMICTLFVLNI